MVERIASRLRATGLRTRLVAAVGAILTVAAAATYVAVYRGTGARIRDQIQTDVETQAEAVASRVQAAGGEDPSAVLRRARRTISAQPAFTPSSRLLVVRVHGAGTATNDPELLGLGHLAGEPESSADRARETAEPGAILGAPLGLSTITLEDAGAVELDSRQVEVGPISATVIAGAPLEPLDRAQDGVSKAFLISGSLTLVAALVLAMLAAARAASPLRRMAQVAGDVDAGELSHRMPESQGALEVRQLAESFNRMLDRLEDAFVRQRTFVSDASHELRTPLTAIRGQIEVLGRAVAPTAKEVAEAEVRIVKEIGRMDRLVEDLLLLAQTDEGLVQRVEVIDPAEFIPETVAGIASGSGRRVVIGAIPTGRLRCDADRLAQVLRSLVRNAIEHTGPTGAVTVSARALGDRLRVTVDDDGPGIPPTQRLAVFDRFHRTDESRARRSGGTGLGLAIAKAIVEAHGGRIWADSSPEGGARLAFELQDFRPV
jgi:two-component system, OmpR family, sensor kinase